MSTEVQREMKSVEDHCTKASILSTFVRHDLRRWTNRADFMNSDLAFGWRVKFNKCRVLGIMLPVDEDSDPRFFQTDLSVRPLVRSCSRGLSFPLVGKG